MFSCLIVQKTHSFLHIYFITAPLSPVWLKHTDFGEVQMCCDWLVGPVCCDWQLLASVQEMSRPPEPQALVSCKY